MGQSLAEAAVRGIVKPTTGISTEARELLDAGDVDGLLAFHRQTFGGYSMVEGDDGDDDSDDDDSDDEDDDDEDDDDEDDKDDKKSKSSAQKRIEELSAESRKHRKKASERGRRIRELEAELEKARKGKQGDKDGDDEPDDDVKQVLEDFPKVLTENEQLRIENAFLRHNKYKWRNPKAALKLADLSDVEINDDGEVEGLDDALESLAKSDPYLLADKSSKDDDDEDDDDNPPKRKRTGQPTGKSKKGNPNRDKLLAKYPALRR